MSDEMSWKEWMERDGHRCEEVVTAHVRYLRCVTCGRDMAMPADAVMQDTSPHMTPCRRPGGPNRYGLFR